MKGIIFTTVERVVSDAHGADAWDTLLDRAEVEGAYTALGNYGSDELVAIAGAAAGRFGMTVPDVVRWFGRAAMPLLSDRYPDFFTPPTLPAFLATLDQIIHPEVRKLYPGARVPSFVVEEVPDAESTLQMVYRSHRSLCWLAEGFVHGAGDHYGVEVSIEQPVCMHAGAEHCVLLVRLDP